ncbi:MAG: hypothetical protein KGN33_07955 [Paracoccaceae bacterium]|nr:hypothetical protein [Paracoccaceae bacterium]
MRGKWVWPPLFVDLASIDILSIPVAVVLSAEFERWKRYKGIALRARRSSRWNHRVKRLLCDLGTFDLLNIKAPTAEENLGTQLVLLPLASGEKTNQEAIDKLQNDLHHVGLLLEEKPYLFDGLTEAVVNSIDHAYMPIPDRNLEFPSAGDRWWATSCYDPESDSLRFFVFDQGHGIPRTLGAQGDWRAKLKSVMDRLGLATTDANMIEAAFEVGRTRTGLDERGKGLDSMHKVIDLAGAGYLRIVSGSGDVKLFADGRTTKEAYGSHIGGTLVEWNLPKAVFTSVGGEHE